MIDSNTPNQLTNQTNPHTLNQTTNPQHTYRRPGPQPKLTHFEVMEARLSYTTTRTTLAKLAANYSVSIRTIYLYIHDTTKRGR